MLHARFLILIYEKKSNYALTEIWCIIKYPYMKKSLENVLMLKNKATHVFFVLSKIIFCLSWKMLHNLCFMHDYLLLLCNTSSYILTWIRSMIKCPYMRKSLENTLKLNNKATRLLCLIFEPRSLETKHCSLLTSQGTMFLENWVL